MVRNTFARKGEIVVRDGFLTVRLEQKHREWCGVFRWKTALTASHQQEKSGELVKF